ncbi:hypothetical protein AAW51_4993 [Caldimonas brevitalea]|uniref:Uncharacterized protein n=1 Tax=Caldimonas brevitalea TaxID=413882 RepID=A0A0G3BQH4_9BURK|nr:hypothetical protein AAW51_4993 [Caldimonas brevitalea]
MAGTELPDDHRFEVGQPMGSREAVRAKGSGCMKRTPIEQVSRKKKTRRQNDHGQLGSWPW